MSKILRSLRYLRNMNRSFNNLNATLHNHKLHNFSDMNEISNTGEVFNNEKLSTYLKKYCHDMHGLIRNASNLLQIIKLELKDRQNLTQYIDSALISISMLNDWSNIINMDLNKYLLSQDSSNQDPLYDKSRYSSLQCDSSRCDLHDIIDRLKVVLLSQITNRNCKIELDNKIPLIKIDNFDALRIFENLIVNSIKHALVENLVIKIELKSNNARSIELLFSDNGNKLPSYVITKIQSILKGKKCENFGLSIVLELLSKYNGNITLVKTKTGCVYKIVLPKY